MKKIILSTTVLTAILFTGCANNFEMQDNSLISDRYKKSEELKDYSLERALSKMKFKEYYANQPFTNSSEELENIEEQIRSPRSHLEIKYVGCQEIRKEGQATKEQYSEILLQDMYDYYAQTARHWYCEDIKQQAKEKIAKKLGLENASKLNIYNNERHYKLVKEMQEKNPYVCELYANETGEKIQDRKGVYVNNINKYDPRAYFDFKIFKDLETGYLSVEVKGKKPNNNGVLYHEILHEDKNICEFTNRSRPETVAANKIALKDLQAKIKYEKENPEKIVYSCEDDYYSGRAISIACQDKMKIVNFGVAKDVGEFKSNASRTYK